MMQQSDLECPLIQKIQKSGNLGQKEGNALRLTDEQSRFYDTFGFLKFPGLFKDDVDDITAAFERVWKEGGREHDFKERSMIVPFADRSEYLSGLLDDPRIDGVVTSILGDNYGYGTSDGNYYVGDTKWHSDHLPHDPYHSLKVAFYLDPVRSDTGCLRVIPGSCLWGDKFTAAVNEVVPVTTGSRPELWGVHGSEVPAYAIESEPGDMLLFNHKLKHSSWGGGDRRRMFTYNFEQYFPDNLIGSLRKLVVPYHERGDDAPYGEALMRTAGPERMRHLEQRLQIWEGLST